MTEAHVRELLEKASTYYYEEGARLKDPNLPVIDFKNFYREEFSDDERPTADRVLAEWALSHDEHRRFLALAVIDDLCIVSALPALRELADRFERFDGPSAPYDWAWVNRIIGRLTGGVGAPEH